MSKRTLNTATGEKLTKQDLQKVYVRNLFGLQWGWNYETMQGLGYCYVIMPILRRLYRNDPEKMKKALKTELGYFNTSQPMSHLIVGTDAALQEELGIDAAEDAVIGVKTGLMGPFAGVGDTVFITIYRALVFSIAAYIAMGGQAIALLIPLVCGVAMLAVRYKFTFLAYEQGRKLASGLSGHVEAADRRRLRAGTHGGRRPGALGGQGSHERQRQHRRGLSGHPVHAGQDHPRRPAPGRCAAVLLAAGQEKNDHG